MNEPAAALHPDLKGRVAVVTGGATGIGRATSLLLARQGASVAIVYSRSADEADEVVAQIHADAGRAMAVQAPIQHPRSVDAMVDTIVQAWGRIDFLVNNAGITRQMRFDDLASITEDTWDDLLAVNVKGTFHCCRAAAPHLRRQPGAAIVNVGSIAGETGYGSSLPYAVSKSAVHGLTRSLARALAPQVRVNCIAPGAVATRWWHGHEDKMHALSGHVALQRVSSPEDIARMVLMLLTADSMTGQTLRTDNGQTL